MSAELNVYIVDDEPLAVERLTRMLGSSSGVCIAGSTTDPATAVEFLSHTQVDAVFLDIEMPGMNGFELLSRLPEQPLVVFTTAYDQYALKAFEVSSIDFLLKPIDPEHLERALKKLERLRGGARPKWMQQPDLRTFLVKLGASLAPGRAVYPERIASRLGERTLVIDLSEVTHFLAKDKLTYAIANGRSYAVDYTIAELEQKLDPKRFVRTHRAVLLNLTWVQELNARYGGQAEALLRDPGHTRVPVSRDRVRALKEKLEL